MSFREKATLRLEPSKDREHQENINKKGDYKALKVISTFGANAAGKTNLFKAMTHALILIRTSNTRQVNQQLGIVPFKFSAESAGKPSRFEFQFIAADNKKYIYGFSADNIKIHEEYLFRFGSRKPTKIFERKEDGTFEFTVREKNSLLPLTQMNTPNKFFIATATMWNAQSTKVPLEWLSSGIDTYTDLNVLTQDSIMSYQGEESKDYINFAEKIMGEADINISKIDVQVKKIPINPNLMPLMPGILIDGQFIQPQEQTQLEVRTFHEVIDENSGNKNVYTLALAEESQGTQMLFNFSPLLKRVLDEGKTIVIDEVDKSLHPAVVKFIIDLFRNEEINKKGAQLIVTTHDTSLLSLNIFRRDQIYLVQKDKKTAESIMYSLDNYSVRKGENIEKGYLLGRYGAVPDIQTGDII
ncbi:MAG: ATP-binding protein [Butyrivibrio sp.]|nr:ATP-binding protein [Butyrivibrio sp.]